MAPLTTACAEQQNPSRYKLCRQRNIYSEDVYSRLMPDKLRYYMLNIPASPLPSRIAVTAKERISDGNNVKCYSKSPDTLENTLLKVRAAPQSRLDVEDLDSDNLICSIHSSAI